MKAILLRFIIIILVLTWGLLTFTLIIPVIFWGLTGIHWRDVKDNILELDE